MDKQSIDNKTLLPQTKKQPETRDQLTSLEAVHKRRECRKTNHNQQDSREVKTNSERNNVSRTTDINMRMLYTGTTKSG